MLTSVSHERRAIRLLRYAHALFGKLAAVFLAGVVINSYVFTVFKVAGQSMEPTFDDGQLIPVALGSYWFSPPRSGDVVVVQDAQQGKTRFTKRIAGVPGDTVTVRGLPVQLAADQFYVVGDNLPHSTDSRIFGPVDRSRIMGSVLATDWRS